MWKWLLPLVLCWSSTAAFADPVLTRGTVTSAAVHTTNGSLTLWGTLGGTIMRPAYPNTGFTMIQGFWNAWSQSSMDVDRSVNEHYRFALNQNQPNPFNPSTTIHFVVADGPASPTHLAIYDVTGRVCRILAHGTYAPGPYAVAWDGCDDHGRALATGVYFVLLRSGTNLAKKQLVLLK